MALISLGGVLEYPLWPLGIKDATTTPANSTLNSATDTYAVIVHILEAGTIDKVHFRVGSSVGTDTIRVSFQNLDSNLVPDGTDTHFRDYTQTGVEDNTMIETGLMTDTGADGGNKKVVSVGDTFAVVITYQTWTSGTLAINHWLHSGDNYASNSVWFDNDGATFTISNNLLANPSVILEYNDATFPYQENTIVAEASTFNTLDDADSPDEYALRLTVPFPCRAVGIFIKGGTVSGVTGTLYDSGDSVLGGGAVSAEVIGITQSKVRYFHFSTPVTLVKDAVYRIAWKPPASPTTSIITTWDYPDAAMRKVFPNGLNMQLSTRVNSGSWTDLPAELMCAGFLIDQLDGGSSGASVSSPPILTPIKSGGHVIY